MMEVIWKALRFRDAPGFPALPEVNPLTRIIHEGS
jgi:hypothetical protein